MGRCEDKLYVLFRYDIAALIASFNTPTGVSCLRIEVIAVT